MRFYVLLLTICVTVLLFTFLSRQAICGIAAPATSCSQAGDSVFIDTMTILIDPITSRESLSLTYSIQFSHRLNAISIQIPREAVFIDEKLYDTKTTENMTKLEMIEKDGNRFVRIEAPADQLEFHCFVNADMISVKKKREIVIPLEASIGIRAIALNVRSGHAVANIAFEPELEMAQVVDDSGNAYLASVIAGQNQSSVKSIRFSYDYVRAPRYWASGVVCGYGWLDRCTAMEDQLARYYGRNELDNELILGFWGRYGIGGNSFELEYLFMDKSNTFFGPPLGYPAEGVTEKEGISIENSSIGLRYCRLIPHGSKAPFLYLWPSVCVQYIWASAEAGRPLSKGARKVLSGSGIGYAVGLTLEFSLPERQGDKWLFAIEYRYRYWRISDTESHSGAIISLSDDTPFDFSGHAVFVRFGLSSD